MTRTMSMLKRWVSGGDADWMHQHMLTCCSTLLMLIVCYVHVCCPVRCYSSSSPLLKGCWGLIGTAAMQVLRCHTSAHQAELLRKGETHFLVTGDVYR